MMRLRDVRNCISNRLDEADRGNRGWFIITRVHVTLGWLQGVAAYLDALGGRRIRLMTQDYQRLAAIIGIRNENPGVQLRRHQLLVMEKPLQLLERLDGRLWEEITLTERGRELAHAADPAQAVERSLAEIRFATEPWTPRRRVTEYRDFNVPVYEVTERVLDRCNGFVDRDEFDFFLSRIREEGEVDWAV